MRQRAKRCYRLLKARPVVRGIIVPVVAIAIAIILIRVAIGLGLLGGVFAAAVFVVGPLIAIACGEILERVVMQAVCGGSDGLSFMMMIMRIGEDPEDVPRSIENDAQFMNWLRELADAPDQHRVFAIARGVLRRIADRATPRPSTG